MGLINFIKAVQQYANISWQAIKAVQNLRNKTDIRELGKRRIDVCYAVSCNNPDEAIRRRNEYQEGGLHRV